MTYFRAIDPFITVIEQLTFGQENQLKIEVNENVAKFIPLYLKNIDKALTAEIKYDSACVLITKTGVNSRGDRLKPKYIAVLRKVVAIYRQTLTSEHNWTQSEDKTSKGILELYKKYHRHVVNWPPNFNWDDPENVLLENKNVSVLLASKAKRFPMCASLHAMLEGTTIKNKISIFSSTHESSFIKEGRRKNI